MISDTTYIIPGFYCHGVVNGYSSCIDVINGEYFVLRLAKAASGVKKDIVCLGDRRRKMGLHGRKGYKLRE
jgi:hypothetical protein